MKITIIVPVFNEEKTVIPVLEKLVALNMHHDKKEIIVVDDGSEDKTAKKIIEFLKKSKSKEILFFEHARNMGKGAAVRTGIEKATGDYLIIQDADLEYNPEDIVRLVEEVRKDHVNVVYGTRLKRLPHFSKEERTGRFMMHYVGNKFLSLVTSMLYGQWVTDMETCYKLFPSSVAKKLSLRAKGFEFEPEITAKLIKRGLKIHEIPITTKPRGYNEGKKLDTFKDGRKALATLVKYRFLD